jgi:hypothetical protein
MGPDYPSETFRVLKNNEMTKYGEYRTQRLVLDAWDRLGWRGYEHGEILPTPSAKLVGKYGKNFADCNLL